MKLRYLGIFMTLASLFALSVSCINDEGGICEDKTYVRFSLNVRAPYAPVSRADEKWSDNYAKSLYENAYDRYISMNTLQVLLFDEASPNIYRGTLSDMFFSQSGDIYSFVGAAPSELTANTAYRIVILANSASAGLSAGTSTLGDLGSLAYSFYDDMKKPNGSHIPMFGVKTATLSLAKGQRQDIGEISLLRSMARVMIYLGENLSGNYDVDSVNVSSYHDGGIVVPDGFAGVSSTAELETEGSVNASGVVKSALPVKSFPARDTLVFYLPEFANKAVAPHATISVALRGRNANGKDTSYVYANALDFKLDGDYCDIVRNHSYNYKITQAYDGSLNFTVEVLPWNLEEEHQSFDNTLVIGQTLKFFTEGTSIQTNADTLLFPKSDLGAVLKITFTLSSPQSGYWRANLEPDVPMDPAFVFCDENGIEKSSGSVGVLRTNNIWQAGKIDGEESTLYVRCKSAASDDNTSAFKFYLYIPTTGNTYQIDNMIDRSGAKKYNTFKLK